MTVEKHLKLTGVSNVSWKDAINKTISEASKSLDYISSVEVLGTPEPRGKKNILLNPTLEIK